MKKPFDQLVSVLDDYPNAMDASSLHGFLTALAIGPNEVLEQSWLQAILNISPKTAPSETMEALENTVMLAVDQTLDEIAGECFHPQIDISETGNKTLKAWCSGFQQATLLAESKWKAFHDVCPDAALIDMTITALIQPKVAEAAFSVPQEKHEAFIAEQAPLLGSAIEAYYQMLIKMGGEEVDDINLKPPTLEDLPRFNKEELTQKSNDELFHLLSMLDDAVPYEVIHECIQRDTPMVEMLSQYLVDDKHWNEAQDIEEDSFWTRLHAIMILGKIPGETAAHGLINTLYRMSDKSDDPFWDWLAGYWPALFRNKPEVNFRALHAMAEDATLGWYTRHSATECVLAHAASQSQETLEQALDWLADLIAVENEDEEFRYMGGCTLLDFVPERHRPLLEKLADQQENLGMDTIFVRSDLNRAYNQGKSQPEWEQFENPWEFYEPKEILKRQQRWYLEETALHDIDEKDELNKKRQNYLPSRVETCVREQPKAGRNDPCPCGSGKKYKKCCLH